MIYADKKYNLGTEWGKKVNRIELAKELYLYWRSIVDKFFNDFYDSYPKAIGHIVHEGNRNAGHLDSVIRLLESGDRTVTDNNLWFPLHNLFIYIILIETFNDMKYYANLNSDGG